MTELNKKIIDTFLLNFEYDSHFENENFIFWVKGKYYYDGESVSFDQFKSIKKYTIHNGILPCVIRNEKRKYTSKDDIHKVQSSYSNDIRIYTGTYSDEDCLRYSKKFNTLEFYNKRTEIRAGKRGFSKRIFVFLKVKKYFSINNKGHVLTDKTRWLSIKNHKGFEHRLSFMNSDLIKLMLTSTIGQKKWIEDVVDNETSYLISNKSSRKASSLEEAFEIECGAKPAKSIKKIFEDDINKVIEFYQLIEPNKIHQVTNFLKKNQERISELIVNRDENKEYFLLFLYFLSKDNRCEYNIVRDYVKMLKDNRQKVNLNISSYATIKLKHDEINKKLLIKKASKKSSSLRVNKIYPDIKSTHELKIEKIRSTKRLIEESNALHHCVHSYEEDIRHGRCAIYNISFNGEGFTLQITKEDKYNYFQEEKELKLKVAQFKGLKNCNPPKDIKPYLDKILQENNISPILENDVVFEDSFNFKKIIEQKKQEVNQEEEQRRILAERKRIQEEEKRKEKKPQIIQVGDKILDLVNSYGTVKRLYKDNIPEKIEPVAVIVDDDFPF